jgi:hypothetical protein
VWDSLIGFLETYKSPLQDNGLRDLIHKLEVAIQRLEILIKQPWGKDSDSLRTLLKIKGKLEELVELAKLSLKLQIKTDPFSPSARTIIGTLKGEFFNGLNSPFKLYTIYNLLSAMDQALEFAKGASTDSHVSEMLDDFEKNKASLKLYIAMGLLCEGK